MNCHHIAASKLNVSFVLCFDVRPKFPFASAELCVKYQMFLQQANKLLSPAKLSSLCSELAAKSDALSTYFLFNIRMWTNTDQPQQEKWTTLIVATVQPWSSCGCSAQSDLDLSFLNQVLPSRLNYGTNMASWRPEGGTEGMATWWGLVESGVMISLCMFWSVGMEDSRNSVWMLSRLLLAVCCYNPLNAFVEVICELRFSPVDLNHTFLLKCLC